MTFESLFAGSLSQADRRSIRRKLTEQRLTAFRSLLSRLGQDDSREKVARHRPRLDRFAQRLMALADAEPERFARIVDHWAATFFLSRLVHGALGNDAWMERLLDHLDGMLIDDAVRSGPASAEASYETASAPGGGFYALLDDRKLCLGDGANGRYAFTFGDRRVRLTPVDGGPASTATLPLGDDGPLTLEPLPRLSGWDLPLLRDVHALGAEESPPRWSEQRDGHPPLEETLADAHRLLAEHWPAVLEWVDVLVPAFVHMGSPPNPRSQRSTSFGPGSPIFLSTASNELLIAEAVVHELQHHRLLLFTRSEDFPLFGDDTRRFVSPWRPDVRPLRGVYLAVHAFLAVNRLRLRVWADGPYDSERRLKLLKTHCMNLYAFRTILEHERPSAPGGLVLCAYGQELADQHAEVEEIAEPEDYRMVEGFFDQHVAEVERQPEPTVNNGPQYRAWDETASLARQLDLQEIAS